MKAIRSSEKFVSFHQSKGFNVPEPYNVGRIKTNKELLLFVIYAFSFLTFKELKKAKSRQAWADR